MTNKLVLVWRRTNPRPFPVSGKGRAVSGRKAQQKCLIFTGQLLVVKQRHDHPGQTALVSLGRALGNGSSWHRHLAARLSDSAITSSKVAS